MDGRCQTESAKEVDVLKTRAKTNVPNRVCPLCKSPAVEEYMNRIKFGCGSKYDDNRDKMPVITAECRNRQATLQNRMLFEALKIIKDQVNLCPIGFDPTWEKNCSLSCLSEDAFKKKSSGCWKRYFMSLAKKRWKE